MSTRVRIVCEIFLGCRAQKRRESKRPHARSVKVKVIYIEGSSLPLQASAIAQSFGPRSPLAHCFHRSFTFYVAHPIRSVVSEQLPPRSAVKHSSQVVIPTLRPCRSSHSLRVPGGAASFRVLLGSAIDADKEIPLALQRGESRIRRPGDQRPKHCRKSPLT